MSAARASASDAESGGAKKGGGLLKNRRFAAGVLAAVIVIGVPLGSARSLKSAAGRVEEQFYTGVNGRGAIADYIDDALKASLGLLSVGANYDAASDAAQTLRDAREDALALMETSRPEITELKSANDELKTAFDGLKGALLNMQLSEQDAANLNSYVSQFEGAEGAVSHSGYNEAADEFAASVMGAFPAKLIGGIFGIDPPAKFE